MRVIKVNGVDMFQYNIELSIYSTSSVEYDESETKPMEGQNGERRVQLQISLLLQHHWQLHGFHSTHHSKLADITEPLYEQ